MQVARRPDADEGTMVAVPDPASGIHMGVRLRGIWKALSSFNAMLSLPWKKAWAEWLKRYVFRSWRHGIGQALIGSVLQAHKGAQ